MIITAIKSSTKFFSCAVQLFNDRLTDAAHVSWYIYLITAMLEPGRDARRRWHDGPVKFFHGAGLCGGAIGAAGGCSRQLTRTTSVQKRQASRQRRSVSTYVALGFHRPAMIERDFTARHENRTVIRFIRHNVPISVMHACQNRTGPNYSVAIWN
jgi:hypothetical protein